MPKKRHRNKGFVPRARTGGLPYNVIRKVCLDAISTDPISTNTSVEEQVLQTEACANKIATMTSMEEQKVQTEVCETEVTESSPKKRRRKRDKVVSSIKE
jgi:hypothetical protein